MFKKKFTALKTTKKMAVWFTFLIISYSMAVELS